MRGLTKSRPYSTAALFVLLIAAPAFGRGPQPQPAPAPNRPLNNAPRNVVRPRQAQNQDHLAQWMERHNNLSLPDQLRALENEPGFHDYPAQTQQRMRDQLVKLNSMTPEQRSKILGRTEAIEQMSPPQRQQFRSAMQEYSALPPDRRRLVARAFKDLREMPQPQRQSIINNDPRFRSQFSDGERATLSNLLAVEPYMPIKGPN
jgi:hypothetical protein